MGGAQWQFGPTRLHSLTAAGRGSGAGSPFPRGRGMGQGPIVFRVRYASRSGKFFPGVFAVWEIFSGSSRSGKFFHRFSLRVCAVWEIFSGVPALQENNFGPKNSDSSRESATAPPVRDPPKFFSNTILFLREFFSKYSRAPSQKRKKCEKIHSHSHNKIIVPLIV